MKKEFIYKILILLLFSSISIFAQNRKTDLQEKNLKTKVSLLKETKFTLFSKDGKFGKSGEFQYSKEYNYDKNGNETQGTIYYQDNGEFESKHMIKYNSKSNIIEEVSFKNNGEISIKHISQYADEDKLLQKRIYNDKNELEEITLYEYTNNGILKRVLYLYRTEEPKLETISTSPPEIKNITRELESDLEQLNVYHSNKIIDNLNRERHVFNISTVEDFDEKGYLNSNMRYTNHGYYLEKKVYTFDDLGNKILKTSFGKNGNPLFVYYYKYDIRRNLIEVYALNNDEKILQPKKEFKYDSKNNLTETIYYNIDGSFLT